MNEGTVCDVCGGPVSFRAAAPSEPAQGATCWRHEPDGAVVRTRRVECRFHRGPTCGRCGGKGFTEVDDHVVSVRRS